MSGKSSSSDPDHEIRALKNRIAELEIQNARQTRELAAFVTMAEQKRLTGRTRASLQTHIGTLKTAAGRRLTGPDRSALAERGEARARAFLSRHPRLRGVVRRLATKFGMLS